MSLDIDIDLLEELSSQLDLRTPNKAAVETIAYDLAAHADRPRTGTFEGVIDSATGVGKTYVIAGAMEYLARAQGVRDFVVIAPGRTILTKTVDNFTPGHRKSLTAGMTQDPLVVTADNFNTPQVARAMEDDSLVKLYVFTVQALLKPKSKQGKRTHDFQEGLGAGLYARLKESHPLVVFADEHHAYYGTQFSNAIRDLEPWALIGLTATPHKKTPEDQVIYRYPLAAAIADRYVKTPVIVGRRDDRKDATTKLLDGVTLLETKRRIADRWAPQHGKSRVNPVMLVVARDTDEANEWAGIVRSDDFKGGAYKDAAIVVHSNVSEADEPKMLQRLAAMEDPDSPIRVVVSVAMLKEGWDVKNVYVLLSTQPSLSDILTEQVLGRGLRLPWGEYTDVEMLDTLEVLAHDRFEDLLRRKDVLNESFIDHQTRAVLKRNAEGELTVVRETTTVNNPVTDYPPTDPTPPEGAEDAEGYTPQPEVGTPAVVDLRSREETGDHEAERFAQQLAARRDINVPRLVATAVQSRFSLADITDFEQFAALGRKLRDNPDDELRRTVIGARIVEDPGGIKRTELVTSDAVDTVRAGARLFPLDELREHLVTAILSSPMVPARPENDRERRAVGRLLDAFLDALDGDAEELLSAYLDRATARLVQTVNEEARKFASKPTFAEVVKVVPLRPERSNSRPVSGHRHGGFKRSVAYEGWTKSVYAVEWFDSSTERDLANVLDADGQVEAWLRLHVGELPIVWSSEGRQYNADFIVVEKNGRHWVVEVKSDRDVKTAEVQAKRQAAKRWANNVNIDAQVAPTEWGYLLASESDIKAARGSWSALKGLAS
jgi:type III restriction enzyme